MRSARAPARRGAIHAGGLPLGLRKPLASRQRRCVQVSQPHSSQNGAAAPRGGSTGVLERPDDSNAPPAREDLNAMVKETAEQLDASANGAAWPMAPHAATAATNGAPVVNMNGATPAGAVASHPVMDSCDAGQLEACAVDRVTQLDQEEASSSVESDNEELPTENKRYAAQGFSAWRRTIQIYTFAIAFAFRYWRLGKKGTYKKMPGGMSKENMSTKRRELAKWLKAGLIRLGPTFIKIGQQFSTRVDVLSPEFIEELESLQDNVPPFGGGAVRATIERDFGRRVEDIFDDFRFKPIAAASLGQVHLATLNGKRVVVKVQRPGLKELFDVDLKNVRVIAQWLQKLDPKSDGAARDWVAIYDECSRILYEEINYRKEAEYARDFAANFAGTDWVKVPEIYTEYLSPEVIVMEYVPGVKINNGEAIDEMGLDREKLARYAVESYLQQLLRHGLFHADPHPGNVAVDAANGGRLIYYDFGMMGRIQPRVREGLRELFYGVYQKDADKCLDALETMGVLVGGDRTAVRRTAQFFLSSFDERLAQQRAERNADPASQAEFKAKRSKDESKAKRKEILSNIGEDLLVASADKPFRFPAEFTFVVRSFSVLDGIGKSLTPRFDISEISAPYARELILDGRSALATAQEKFQKGLSRQNQAVKGLFNGPLTIEEISRSLQRIENGDTKPRVRALEVERAMQRMQVQQGLVVALVCASMLANIGTVLSVSALPVASTCAFVAAGFCGLLTLAKFAKVQSLQKKELQLTGAV